VGERGTTLSHCRRVIPEEGGPKVKQSVKNHKNWGTAQGKKGNWIVSAKNSIRARRKEVGEEGGGAATEKPLEHLWGEIKNDQRKHGLEVGVISRKRKREFLKGLRKRNCKGNSCWSK